MKMRWSMILGMSVVVVVALTGARTFAATAVSAAAGPLIDSDGDGVPDLTDNAPGAFNPSQVDMDGDQYGDVIDPTPSMPGPLVDIGFAIGGTYYVSPGAGVTINFTTTNSPPGDFGHINLYMEPGNIVDGYAFQSLATPGGSFFIPANLFTDPTFWDLNTPGTYTLEAWGLSSGEIDGYKGGDATVIVVPEPATIGILPQAGSSSCAGGVARE